jgi:hypothetical protein
MTPHHSHGLGPDDIPAGSAGPFPQATPLLADDAQFRRKLLTSALFVLLALSAIVVPVVLAAMASRAAAATGGCGGG